MSRARWAAVVVGLFVVAAVGVACNESDSEGAGDGATGGGGGGTVAETGAARASADQAASLQRTNRSLGSAARLPSLGPSVIKTATLEVEVARDEVGGAVGDATQIAGRLAGFVASTQIDAAGMRSGTVVLRVPAERFEAALAELRSLGDVRATSVSGQDVSQEFVDLQARLRNWQSQEAVLLRLMDRSVSVTDTIRVQGELSRVQLEIERLRGRLTFLEDQTALGTITATFTGGSAAPAPPSTLERAFDDAREATLAVVAAVVVGAGFLLPIALLAGLVLLLFRGLRPRLGA